jgi:hypothetical protein
MDTVVRARPDVDDPQTTRTTGGCRRSETVGSNQKWSVGVNRDATTVPRDAEVGSNRTRTLANEYGDRGRQPHTVRERDALVALQRTQSVGFQRACERWRAQESRWAAGVHRWRCIRRTSGAKPAVNVAVAIRCEGTRHSMIGGDRVAQRHRWAQRHWQGRFASAKNLVVDPGTRFSIRVVQHHDEGRRHDSD